MKALICFHNHGIGYLQRWMRPGFRHAFIVIKSDDYWIRQDGFRGMPTTEVIAPSHYDLATFYRDVNGYTVLEVEVERIPLWGPFMQRNCTGMVKAWLSISAPFVFTPWQLHRCLVKRIRGRILC